RREHVLGNVADEHAQHHQIRLQPTNVRIEEPGFVVRSPPTDSDIDHPNVTVAAVAQQRLEAVRGALGYRNFRAHHKAVANHDDSKLPRRFGADLSITHAATIRVE